MHSMYPVRYGNRHNTFNPIWNAFFSPSVSNADTAATSTATWVPAVDIRELEGEFRLLVDIPGMTAGDVELTVEKNVLTMTGKRNQTEASVENGYAKSERRTGEFKRRFTLPDDVDAEAISANAEHGVLTVTIPRNRESTVRKIAING